MSSDDRDGPLPNLLLVLTFTTGVVDAVSFVGLGHVFVANMTGTVALLGFFAGGAPHASLEPMFTALGGFLVGTMIGGWIVTTFNAHRGRLLLLGLQHETLLVAAATIFALVIDVPPEPIAQAAIVAMLAIAMGIRNVVVRHLQVADLNTTTLTQTLTSLVADAIALREAWQRASRRLVAIVALFVGAVLGVFLQRHLGTPAPLALTFAALIATTAATRRANRSGGAWTTASG